MGDQHPQPFLEFRGPEAGLTHWRPNVQGYVVVGKGGGQSVRCLNGIHENEVGPALGVPLDARD